MKKDNLLKGAAVLGALALMAGGVVAADAAVNSATDNTDNSATSTKTAWKGQDGNGGRGFANNFNGLTDEEKAAKIAEMEANRTANQAAMEAKRTAAEAAITAGDYDAWVTAEGSDSPLVAKVTKENFPKFIEAHNLMTQARTILAGIGLESGAGKGMGMGMGFGGGHMMDK